MKEEIEVLDLDGSKNIGKIEEIPELLSEDGDDDGTPFVKTAPIVMDTSSSLSSPGEVLEEEIVISSYEELIQTFEHYEAIKTRSEVFTIAIETDVLSSLATINFSYLVKGQGTHKKVLYFNNMKEFNESILPRFVEKYASIHLITSEESGMNQTRATSIHKMIAEDGTVLMLKEIDGSVMTQLKEIIKKQNHILEYKRKPYNQMALNNQYHNHLNRGYTSPFLLAFVMIMALFITLLVTIGIVK